MTRRIIAFPCGNVLHISQEFNGDRDEGTLLLGTSPVKVNWSDIVALFDGIETLEQFTQAVEQAEALYGYESEPLEEVSYLPEVEQLWKVVEQKLVLWARYGQPEKCNSLAQLKLHY